MYLGEKKRVLIPAEQAYGPHHERNVDTVERSRLPPTSSCRSVGSSRSLVRMTNGCCCWSPP
jgi:FKBP-type peptidyl-prolyl cis-trans isomerase 2